jgi:3-oxoacyl-[acyl-carrier protein] reductase
MTVILNNKHRIASKGSFDHAWEESKMSLSNKVVVVTGAASGMGRATALMLADMGAHLGLLDLTIPDDLLSKLKSFGVQTVPLPCDVRDSEAVDEALRKLAETIGPIDGD